MRRAREDFIYPDVITASEDYQKRFNGEVGQFLLETQRALIFKALSKNTDKPLRILELGGAHGQLTLPLLHAGHSVVVQCSKLEGFDRLSKLRELYGERLRLVVSPPETLPFGDAEFDVVVMVRLLSHLERWTDVVREGSRVCKSTLVFDYPPVCSFNVISPLFFNIKKRIEGNTRRYTCFSDSTMKREVGKCGFSVASLDRQFFLPMALHRLWNNPKRSIAIEEWSKKCGLTKHFGSPVIIAAQRDSQRHD